MTAGRGIDRMTALIALAALAVALWAAYLVL